MRRACRAQASVIALALLTIAVIGTSALFLSLLSTWHRAYLAQERALQLLSDKGKESVTLTWRWDPPGNPNAHPIITVRNDGTIGLKVVRVIFEEKVGDDITKGPYVIPCDAYIDVGSTVDFKLPVKFNKNLYISVSSRKLIAIVVTERSSVFKSVYNEEPPTVRAVTFALDQHPLYWSWGEINGFDVPVIGRLEVYSRFWRPGSLDYKTLGPLRIPRFWEVRNAEDAHATANTRSFSYREYYEVGAQTETSGRTRSWLSMWDVGGDREAEYWHVIRIVVPVPVEVYRIRGVEVTINYAVEVELHGVSLLGGKFSASDDVYLMLKASVTTPLDDEGYTHGLHLGWPKQLAYLYLEVEGLQSKRASVERMRTLKFVLSWPSENVYVGDKLVLELVVYHRMSLDYEGDRSDVRVEMLIKSFKVKLVLEELVKPP